MLLVYQKILGRNDLGRVVGFCPSHFDADLSCRWYKNISQVAIRREAKSQSGSVGIINQCFGFGIANANGSGLPGRDHRSANGDLKEVINSCVEVPAYDKGGGNEHRAPDQPDPKLIQVVQERHLGFVAGIAVPG